MEKKGYSKKRYSKTLVFNLLIFFLILDNFFVGILLLKNKVEIFMRCFYNLLYYLF